MQRWDRKLMSPDYPTRLQLAMRPIKNLGLTGDYSGIDDEEQSVLELWFANEADAKQYAEAVQAKPPPGRNPASPRNAPTTSVLVCM